jgi:hypothetical protein
MFPAKHVSETRPHFPFNILTTRSKSSIVAYSITILPLPFRSRIRTLIPSTVLQRPLRRLHIRIHPPRPACLILRRSPCPTGALTPSTRSSSFATDIFSSIALLRVRPDPGVVPQRATAPARGYASTFPSAAPRSRPPAAPAAACNSTPSPATRPPARQSPPA